MAIIYSYPLSTPKRLDLLIGTSTFDENDLNSKKGNPTVSFTIDSLLDMISTGGVQTLQQVTNLGSTTTNAITINSNLTVSGNLNVGGAFLDSTSSPGTLNQVLSSTVTGTKWVADDAGLNYFVTGASFDTDTGELSITGNNAAVGATVDLDGRYITGNQTITLSGDIAGSGATAITTTLASVNTNIGDFTNANISVNAKGLVTAASSGTAGGVTKIVAGSRITITPASGLGDVTINSAAEVDTLQTVTSRGSTTNQSITMNGSGTNGYLYVSGNAGNPVTNPVHTQGFAFAYNNSGGSRECEIFWNTGTTTAATNNVAYLGFYNEFLNSAASNARVTDLQMKLYGTGQLELTGNTPTISNPYWRMPTTAAPNTGYVLAKSSGSINLEWVVNGNSNSGIVEEVVVNAGVASLAKTITIPSGATSVQVNGFSSEGLTGVVLPAGLITINEKAFEDNKIKSVAIPSTVAGIIGQKAFEKNDIIGSIVIPSGVTQVADFVFNSQNNQATAGITSLTFTAPSSLTTIGTAAFQYHRITSITFPNSLTSIGSSAFANFYASTLTSIIFPSTAITTASGAFSSTFAGTTLTIPNNSIIEGFDNSSNLTTLNLGTGITLGESVFQSCNSLITVTLPTGTVLTGTSHFFQCTSLTTVNIPTSITVIPSNFIALSTAFTGGTNLLSSGTFASQITEFKWQVVLINAQV